MENVISKMGLYDLLAKGMTSVIVLCAVDLFSIAKNDSNIEKKRNEPNHNQRKIIPQQTHNRQQGSHAIQRPDPSGTEPDCQLSRTI